MYGWMDAMRILYIGSPRSAVEVNEDEDAIKCEAVRTVVRWEVAAEREKLYENCPGACRSVELRRGHDMRSGTRARIWSWPKITETSR